MKKFILALVVGAVLMVTSSSAFAHSGRTTTSNDYGIPGHVNHSTGMWHSHI